ncbi:MAG: hypothetical protein ACLUQ6_04760 [Alistipes onderdonkii]
MYASSWVSFCTDGHRSRRYTSTAAIRCTIRTPASGAGRGTAGRKAPAVPAPRRKILRRFDHRPHVRKRRSTSLSRGPSYSKNTSLGIGLLAAGLYRIDRTDSVTAPSDISDLRQCLDFGILCAGVTGNNIFARNSKRIDYDGNVRLGAPRHVGHRLPRRTV